MILATFSRGIATRGAVPEASMELPEAISSVLKHKGSQVHSIAPDASVFDAIAAMAEKKVGALMVTQGGKLIGIISERDYARKVILRGRSSKETNVSEIMSSPVVFVSPRHTIGDCMRIMTESRIRHLPVLSDENIVGMISIGDLVNWIISAQQETIRHLEAYITGTPR
jgi:CBS domain-containing protein